MGRRPKQHARPKTNACPKKHASPPTTRHRPVGWFAASDRNALCDGDALIVAKSKLAIRQLAKKLGGRWRFAPTSFEEILQGMQHGGAYAFDEGAYELFLPPAQEAGLDLQPEDFSEPAPESGPLGMHFVRVQLPTIAFPFTR